MLDSQTLIFFSCTFNWNKKQTKKIKTSKKNLKEKIYINIIPFAFSNTQYTPPKPQQRATELRMQRTQLRLLSRPIRCFHSPLFRLIRDSLFKSVKTTFLSQIRCELCYTYLSNFWRLAQKPCTSARRRISSCCCCILSNIHSKNALFYIISFQSYSHHLYKNRLN